MPKDISPQYPILSAEEELVVPENFQDTPVQRVGNFRADADRLTAKNISLIAGDANTARLEVGSDVNTGGVNSANASTDIVFWAGKTHANRATAPFRVDAAGAITATDLTISSITWDKASTLYSFESTDGWETAAGGVGAAITPQAGRIIIKSGDAVDSISRITALWTGLSTFLTGTTDANPLIQCQAVISNTGTATGDGSFFIGYGDQSPLSAAPTAMFGFEWNYTDTKLYAVTKKSGSAATKTEITGINVTNRHIFKAIVSGSGATVKFYVDGSLKTTISDATFTIDSDYGPVISVQTKVINQRPTLIIGNLFTSQDF